MSETEPSGMTDLEKMDLSNIIEHIVYALRNLSKIVDPEYEEDADGESTPEWVKQIDTAADIIEDLNEKFGEETDDGTQEGRKDQTETKTETEAET